MQCGSLHTSTSYLYSPTYLCFYIKRHIQRKSTTQTHLPIMSQVPRGLRACLVCSFVQAANKWSKTGCPNCEDFLELRNSSDAIGDCTSEVFEGLVTVNDTSTGWVSRWLRIQGYVPGVYATKVNGLVSCCNNLILTGTSKTYTWQLARDSIGSVTTTVLIEYYM